MELRTPLRRIADGPWPERVRRTPLARRAAARALGRPSRAFRLDVAPPQPIGAKFELTFACNLRCGFCYTDSPRHTLARTPELDDDAWRKVAREAIELGILEAVVTGGEPLLRRDLALEILEELDAAGVTTYLNTNGWFIDDAVADRLGALRALHVYVSIDGATAAAHDSARGVPGSWRRAVDGASRLLDRGVLTHVVQVVTPENRHEVGESLELFWRLGVSSLQLSPVGLVGAAARSGSWHVDPRGLAALVDRARPKYGPDMGVVLRGGGTERFDPLDGAPTTILVRPDGVVRIQSTLPFSFGDVRAGFAPAWEAVRAGWDGPEVKRWVAATKRRRDLPDADVVPYLDEDAPVATAGLVAPAPGGRDAPTPEHARARKPEHVTLGAAAEYADGLAFGRRMKLGTVRWTDAGGGARFVSAFGSGRMTKLNPTAAAVMAACDDGTPADAVAALRARHPSVPEERLRTDVVRAVRMLTRRGVLVPALAPERAPRAGGEAPEPAAALTT